MPKHLILVAHAETLSTRRGVFPTSEGLEPGGRMAAERLASDLPRSTQALASPAPAARETAKALGLIAEAAPALTDIDVGRWAGRAVMDIGVEDPEGAAAWMEDPTFAGHGGESFEKLVERVGMWLASRVAIDGVTIAVTHAAVLRAATIAVLGAPLSAFWRIEAAPLARLSLGSNGTRWLLRELRQP